MVGQHLRRLQKKYEAAKQRLAIIDAGVRGVEGLRVYADQNQINIDVLQARMAEGKAFAEKDPDTKFQQELLRLRNQEETVLYLIEQAEAHRPDPLIPQEWITWISGFISHPPLTANQSSSLSNDFLSASLDPDELF